MNIKYDNPKYDSPKYGKQKNEKDIDYMMRLVGIKLTNRPDYLDWFDIVKLCKLDVHHDTFRKAMQPAEFGAYAVYKKFKETTNDNTRILTLSDLHVPFNVNINVLAKYANKVDILLLNGDITDCQALSKFTKKYRVSFIKELIATRKLLIELNDLIKPKQIVVNYGNHDERLSNYFANNINVDLMRLMPKTSLDLIVNQGFTDNNHVEGTTIDYKPLDTILDNIEFTKNWYNQIGQTIFCHPKACRQGILGTGEKVWQYMNQCGYNFDSLVVAHTHQLGFAKYGTTYLYESGCMCKEQEYATSGRLSKPQNKGYIYLEQDKEGKLVYDKCKLEVL